MISALLMAAALVFSREDAKAVFDLTGEFVDANPCRDAGTDLGRKACDWIQERVSVCGGSVARDDFRAKTPDGMRTFSNLYCSFERRSGSPWAVLVSHYDTKPGTGCPGANDGASTSCLLIHLAKVLSDSPGFDRNVMLIWTDGEECRGRRYTDIDGFQGSKRAAGMLKRKGVAVSGVYVLDMLGDRDLKISIPQNVSTELATRVLASAKRLGLGRDRLERFGSAVLDDHVAFKDAGFKAVDLIDFEYGSKPGLNDFWHTPHDTQDKLSADSFLTVGRLVCELLSAEEKSE